MTRINVLSINPTQITLGALNPENILKKGRNKVCRTSSDVSAPSYSASKKKRSHIFGIKSRLNFFFGINSETGNKTSCKLLISRTLFSAILVSWCLLSYTSVPMEVLSVFLVTGLLLFIGLFARVTTFCSFIAASVYALVEMNTASVFDPTMSMFALGCLTFCLFGPGKVSLDAVIRNRVIRLSRLMHIRRVRKEAEMRLGYKAYSVAE